MYINLYTNQTERRIYEVIADSALHLGFSIVRIRLSRKNIASNLQVPVAHSDNKQKVTLSDCAQITHHIKLLIEVNNLLPKFNLEVSSAGINRPLTRSEDFMDYIGSPVKIKAFTDVVLDRGAPSRVCLGTILSASEESVKITLEDGKSVEVAFSNIKEASLDHDISTML